MPDRLLNRDFYFENQLEKIGVKKLSDQELRKLDKMTIIQMTSRILKEIERLCSKEGVEYEGNFLHLNHIAEDSMGEDLDILKPKVESFVKEYNRLQQVIVDKSN